MKKPAIFILGHVFTGDRHWEAAKRAIKWFESWRGLSTRYVSRLIDDHASYSDNPEEGTHVLFCYFDYDERRVLSYDEWNPLPQFQPNEVHL